MPPAAVDIAQSLQRALDGRLGLVPNLLLEDAYRCGRQNRGQARRDLDLAHQRAGTGAQRAAQAAGHGGVDGSTGSTAAGR